MPVIRGHRQLRVNCQSMHVCAGQRLIFALPQWQPTNIVDDLLLGVIVELYTLVRIRCAIGPLLTAPEWSALPLLRRYDFVRS